MSAIPIHQHERPEDVVFRPRSAPIQPVPDTEPDLPAVTIDTDEHRVADEVLTALVVDEHLYHRGGILVRVVRDQERQDEVIRPAGAPTIAAAPLAYLRETITRNVRLVKMVAGRRGPIERASHPPDWLVKAIGARGEWPTLRRLNAISDAPVLRPDGSVHQTPGYDPTTGVLYEPAGKFPPLPNEIDVADAIDRLFDVVADFRFERPEHRSAWLAGVLTPLARHAFDGPSPLFLTDANVRGAGKGLLNQVTAEIVLGRPIPVFGYVHDAAEFSKRVTAIALAGDAMVLLDNLTGAFGNEPLDRALTASRWKDRLLSLNQTIDLPLTTVWYGTGNNVSVAADTARRIIHIRLDVLEEKPEERGGFEHPNLLEFVRQRRGELLTSAVGLLAAYCRAGRPRQALTPFGSFEGWSALVRSAVVWCGLPDPCATRAQLAETADTASDVLGQVLDAWQQYDPHGLGLIVAELIARLYPREYPSNDPESVAMRAALEALAGSRPGLPPTTRSVGKRLSAYRRRVHQGRYLDVDASRRNSAGKSWRLFYVKNEGRSDCSDFSDSL